MNISIKQTLFIAFSFVQFSAFSQFTYTLADSIKFSENGVLLNSALAGGLNAPQFNEIDLNGDGKNDIVIFDRAGNKAIPYINKGSDGVTKYEYAPRYIKQFPRLSDWMKLIDFNCDGLNDLFTGDGSGNIISHQNIGSVGNTQFAPGEIVYRKGNTPNVSINLYARKPDLPGIADIDGDGDIDFLTFSATQINYHKNVSVDSLGICGLKFEFRNACWGRFAEGGLDDQIFLDSCGYNTVTNPEIVDGGKGTPHNNDKHSGSTVTLFDFDNKDGMDLLLGDVSSLSVKRLMNGDQSPGFKTSRIVSYDPVYPPDSNDRNKISIFPSSFIQDFNNDGLEDLILTVNATQDVLALNKDNIRLFINTGTPGNPNFSYVKNNFLQEDMLDFGKSSLPTFFDYNSDGLMDIVVGNESSRDDSTGNKGRLALLKNVGSLTNPKFTLVDRNYLQIDTLNLEHISNKATEWLATGFGDLDADGDQDMIIGDDTGRLHYFENIANPGAEADFRLKENNFEDIDVGNKAVPKILDLDKDGKLDLLVGEQSGNLNFYRNRGTNAAPIFNLKIDSIVWEGNFIFKYYLKDNPDLSGLTLNQRYEISETNIPANKGSLFLTAINQNDSYLSFRNYVIDSDTINESGKGYINVAYDSVGNVKKHISTSTTSTSTQPSNGSQPIFYDYQGQLQLITATNEGEIKVFTDIDSNIYGNFSLYQANALDYNLGNELHLDAADLNNDGKIDLVVGNQSGGINILYGDGFVGIDNDHPSFESSNKIQLKVYPNPSEGEFNVQFSNFEEGKSYQLKVYDLVGKLVFEKTLNQAIELMNLSRQNKGIYFIQIQADGKISKAEKLIIR